MKTQTEMLKWLRANLGKTATAGLTSTDTYALVTSVNLCNLISYQGAPPDLFAAYRAIVSQMQPGLRHLAYHAIACELDWSHRRMIWDRADLAPHNRITTRCEHEPK
ncbi:MAG: hypothetical protein KGL39_45340 [Patescibacteria group bacterium]|nr:hypothetical protein [Patescibacteria group bacterium]